MPILHGQTGNDLRGQCGAALRSVINLEGKVLSSRIERCSGFRTLHDEALSLPTRGRAHCPNRNDVKGDTIELVVPVEFIMR